MRRKKDKSNGITALYERLSRDDDNAGESNSIVHQKQMLEDYAMKHGFTNLVHFTDDGWSGATFDRPSWNRLVEGVKNGEITACICKDMSRIGRDHLQVGFFTDILFREKEVRFIAINNGIDSDRQETSEFGAMFPTGTKTDADSVSMEELQKIRAAVSLPIVVIGGINKGNAGRFKPMGIDGLAVVSAIIAQSDIKAAAAELKDLFCGKEKKNGF